MIVSGMDRRDVLALLNDYYSIENTLRRRGFDVKEKGSSEQVIQTTEEFYNSMKSFPFRQVLRCIYEKADGVTQDDILGQFGNLNADSLRKKIEEMVSEGCVLPAAGENLCSRISGKEFGITFEWFLAELLKREMRGIARFGIKLLNLKCGGDYDVIGRMDDVLVYIECKSGSIHNVTVGDIKRFIARAQELVPSLSVLLVDTNGLTDSFRQQCLDAQKGDGSSPPQPLRRRKIKPRGLFYELLGKTYVLTSEGNLVSNLKLVVNHFFSFEKPYGGWAPDIGKLGHYDEYEE